MMMIPGIVLLAGLTAGGMLYLRSSRPPMMPEPPATQTSSPRAETLKEETLKGETPTGLLSVQVVPWGTIIIDGKDSYESPLKQLSLAAGDHHLKVFYEPRKEQHETRIHLDAGVHAVCLADFRKRGGGIACR